MHDIDKTHENIQYTDLRKESDMEQFIGNDIYDVIIRYGGKRGAGKSVEIFIKLKNFSLKFNFRNKQTGLLPTSMQADFIKNK